MLLHRITDEKDLKDGRTYLCCRLSRMGNTIWETLEAQKHSLRYEGLLMPFKDYALIYDLPKKIAEIESG